MPAQQWKKLFHVAACHTQAEFKKKVRILTGMPNTQYFIN